METLHGWISCLFTPLIDWTAFRGVPVSFESFVAQPKQPPFEVVAGSSEEIERYYERLNEQFQCWDSALGTNSVSFLAYLNTPVSPGSICFMHYALKVVPATLCDQRYTGGVPLRSLTLSMNQLDEYSFPMGHFNSLDLQELRVGGNNIRTFPRPWLGLRMLQRLSLMHNGLSVLPEEITKLSFLELLDVSFNELTYLPSTLGQLSRLRKLDVTHNLLTAFPPELAELTKMGSLNILAAENPLGASFQRVPRITAKVLLSPSIPANVEAHRTMAFEIVRTGHLGDVHSIFHSHRVVFVAKGWAVGKHHLYPEKFRKAVEAVLLLQLTHELWCMLPSEILFTIFKSMPAGSNEALVPELKRSMEELRKKRREEARSKLQSIETARAMRAARHMCIVG